MTLSSCLLALVMRDFLLFCHYKLPVFLLSFLLLLDTDLTNMCSKPSLP